MDLNVRVIKAVECCPSLYKGHTSLSQRQIVWQQISEQMRVPESIVKTRWHLLCSWYQRCLEKQRSTDDETTVAGGGEASNFRYEKEMAFMTPYIHARITIAAANAARKKQELALTGANDLTEPEFVITENDIEHATAVSNELSADYTFYEVETFEHHDEQEDLTDGDGGEIVETSEAPHELSEDGEYIQHIDESGNIVMQDIIYETTGGVDDDAGDHISEDGNEIEIEADEDEAQNNHNDEDENEAEEGLLQMDDDQIEVQNEQIIEEIVEDDSHAQHAEDQFITETYDVMATPIPTTQTTTTPTTTPIQMPTTTTMAKSARSLRLPVNNGEKFIKIVDIKTDGARDENKQQQPQETPKRADDNAITTTTTSHFPQEYALTRRRAAVVLKATPRVQVELTDNSAANVLLQQQQQQQQQQVVGNIASAADTDSCIPKKLKIDENLKVETTTTTTTTVDESSSNSNVNHQSNHENLVVVTSPKAISQAQASTVLVSSVTAASSTTTTSDAAATTATAACVANSKNSESPSKAERSEDTIFGELVTAMLKQMPKERKRVIKKNIMDLLLT